MPFLRRALQPVRLVPGLLWVPLRCLLYGMANQTPLRSHANSSLV